MRTNMRAVDLLDAYAFVEKVVAAFNTQPIEFRETMSVVELKRQARKWSVQLAPLVTDTDQLIRSSWKAGANILLEGAQGTFLDLDYGTYPFCTSSDCTTYGALKGAGLAPQAIGRVIGVVKAYVTRVGAGPFPTILHDSAGESIQRVGHEFGTRTGRKRDCGWFDVPLVRHAAEINGLSELTMTKLDVLSGLDEVKIGVGYVLDGKTSATASFEHVARLAEVKVEYETLPGWSQDISGITRWDDLPKNAQDFVKRVESLVGLPITAISTSPKRGDIITNKDYYSYSTFPKSVCMH